MTSADALALNLTSDSGGAITLAPLRDAVSCLVGRGDAWIPRMMRTPVGTMFTPASALLLLSEIRLMVCRERSHDSVRDQRDATPIHRPASESPGWAWQSLNEHRLPSQAGH